MAINMGLTLFLHICFLITVHCFTSEEPMSTENISEILDKLILKTQQINDTGPTADIKDLTPVDETQPDLPNNDSNIYYFKTFVTPRINFKSSSETVHGTRHSNKTVQSLEFSNDDHDPTSEDKPFQGTSKITRKSFPGVANKKEFMSRLLHGGHETTYSGHETIHSGHETIHSEFKARPAGRTGSVNDYSLEDFIKKEVVEESSTSNDNKQISFTQSAGHQNQQLSSLHEWPEIIIDQITYDNDEDPNRLLKENSTHDIQHVENIVKETNKGEIIKKVPLAQPRKIRYNIPEEEIEVPDQDHDIPEHFGPRNYFTPERKDLLKAMIQKQVMHDALLKQTTESKSRKQNLLLENILQRLPERRQMTSNHVQPSYSVRHEHIAPAEMETYRNGGNRLTNSYLNVPYVPSQWEIHKRLLRRLVRLFRPDVLKRTRLIAAGVIDRIEPNIGYQPVYYDLYKK